MSVDPRLPKWIAQPPDYDPFVDVGPVWWTVAVLMAGFAAGVLVALLWF